jgi:hypothetical protein
MDNGRARRLALLARLPIKGDARAIQGKHAGV